MADDFLHVLVGTIAYQLVGVSLFLPFELAFPKARIPFRRRFVGILFLVGAAPFAAAVAMLVAAAGRALGVHPVPLHLGFASPIIAAFVAAQWADLQFYIEHRLQHKFFWRFHAVHHSPRDLSAANSFHHWTEAFMGLTTALPLMFWDVEIGPTLGFLSAIFQFQQFYIHSASVPHFGRLRWLFVDNRYHRIHHSIHPEHFDKNFGAMTPLWDWVFGSLYMPKDDEWPDVGVEGCEPPHDFKTWLFWPWRSGRTA